MLGKKFLILKRPWLGFLLCKKGLDKKNISIGKLKSSLHAAKSKVSSFLSDVLSRRKDYISKGIIFTAYQDNINWCSDIDFPSLHNTRINYKRKLDIL